MVNITLATLPDATEQEVFDHVVRGLGAQGFLQSVEVKNSDSCAYRGADGRKCAAGHCMSDVEYAALQARTYSRHNDKEHPGIEGWTWEDLLDLGIVPGSHKSLIGLLQNAHDQSTHPQAMRARLVKLAGPLRLSPDAIPPLPEEN